MKLQEIFNELVAGEHLRIAVRDVFQYNNIRTSLLRKLRDLRKSSGDVDQFFGSLTLEVRYISFEETGQNFLEARLIDGESVETKEYVVTKITKFPEDEDNNPPLTPNEL